ncbi:Ig-like domain-containing protein [Photobacterium leiognathi]|uniref:Ig-like domain-containing protein n=1 Tax=Photobacterium leiognathi TaxID=553611 RepID=UPI00298225D9|nr:Ig-like domain-containing protein [Photobacterium leiognathi]
MLFKTVIKKGASISIVLLLAACGGGDESAPVISPTKPKPISILDGFSTVVPEVETFIDLKPYLGGDNAKITDVQEDKDNPLCGIPLINGTGINVEVKEGTFCQFSYKAEQTGMSQGKASLNVLATKAAVPMLPPISQALIVGSGATTFNVETLLGDSWKATYRLNIDSVQVQGLESNLGTEEVVSNSIVFTPPSLAGWNRIIFTLDDTAAPGESVMGVIYVSISDEVNQPPEIEQKKYLYNFAPANEQYVVTWGQDRSDYPDGVLTEYDGSLGDKGDISTPVQRKHAKEVLTRSLKQHSSIMVDMTPWANGALAARKLWVDDADKALDGTMFAWRVTKSEKPSWLSYIDYHGFIAHLGDKNEGSLYWRNIGGLWYTASSHGIKPFIYKGEKLTVNLNTLPSLNIKDPDSDEWQLIDVHSWSADVVATEPDSVTNKSFDFTASTVGSHYVTYIIADHFGGYAVGIIQIDVSARGGAPTWVDIKAGGNTYLAPQTYVQASASGYAVTGIWDEGVNNTLAGYRQQTANIYCNSVGTLPTEADMNVLRNANISGSSLTGELAKWPVQQSYIVKSGDGVATYDLISGSTQEYNYATQNYVTCLKKTTGMSLTVNNYKVVANGERVSFAMVRMPSAADTFRLDKLAGSLSESDVDFQLGKKVEATTEITTQSTKVGTYSFSVTDSKDPLATVTSSTIRYIGDSETGKFEPTTGLVIKTNNATPDGISENRLVATLTDINDNPIEGERLNIEITENGDANDSAKYTFNPVSGRTNDKGQLEIKITNTEKETVDVRAVFVRPIDGVEEYSDTAKISYYNSETYPCHGVKGDYDCLPVQEQRDKEGWLFTPSASLDFYNSSGLKDYLLGYWVENNSFRFEGPAKYGISDLWALTIRNGSAPSGYQCKFLNIEGHAGRKNWRRALAPEMYAFAQSNLDPNDMEAWPGFNFRTTGGGANQLFLYFAGVEYINMYGKPVGSYVYSRLLGAPENTWASYVEHELQDGYNDYYGYMCVSPPA